MNYNIEKNTSDGEANIHFAPPQIRPCIIVIGSYDYKTRTSLANYVHLVVSMIYYAIIYIIYLSINNTSDYLF